jgi:uncharacterized protein YjbI with pentapeptide repeats
MMIGCGNDSSLSLSKRKKTKVVKVINKTKVASLLGWVLSLLMLANSAIADVVYLVSSNGVSTSHTGDFPVGTKFSGSLTVNGLPNNLPANSNLLDYLTSFRFTDGSGTIYSNTTQNQIAFTGQTDASGKITAYALTGSVSGGLPSFIVSPGPNGISSKPFSSLSAEWTGPSSLNPPAPPAPPPKPTSTAPSSVNGCSLKHRTICPNLIVRDLNLTGVNLSSSFLVNADFTGTNLTNANLTGAQLSGAIFDGATMTGAKLQGADLSGCSLQTVKLENANLSRANLTKANISSANLKNTNLTKAIAIETNFSSSDLTGTNLFQITAAKANFSSVTLVGSNLKNAYLARAVFSNATISQVLVNYKTVLTGAALDTNGPITTN